MSYINFLRVHLYGCIIFFQYYQRASFGTIQNSMEVSHTCPRRSQAARAALQPTHSPEPTSSYKCLVAARACSQKSGIGTLLSLCCDRNKSDHSNMKQGVISFCNDMPHRVTFFCCYATIKSLLLCYAPKKQTTTIYKKGQREMRRNVCCSTTYYSELGSGALHSCPVYLPLHKNTYIVREFHCLISFGKIFYCRTVQGYACIYTLFIDMK